MIAGITVTPRLKPMTCRRPHRSGCSSTPERSRAKERWLERCGWLLLHDMPWRGRPPSRPRCQSARPQVSGGVIQTAWLHHLWCCRCLRWRGGVRRCSWPSSSFLPLGGACSPSCRELTAARDGLVQQRLPALYVKRPIRPNFSLVFCRLSLSEVALVPRRGRQRKQRMRVCKTQYICKT